MGVVSCGGGGSFFFLKEGIALTEQGRRLEVLDWDPRWLCLVRDMV